MTAVLVERVVNLNPVRLNGKPIEFFPVLVTKFISKANVDQGTTERCHNQSDSDDDFLDGELIMHNTNGWYIEEIMMDNLK